MERFPKYVQNQRKLNSFKTTKGGHLLYNSFLKIFFHLSERFAKIQKLFHFQKNKKLMKFFFQNVLFHRSKRQF